MKTRVLISLFTLIGIIGNVSLIFAFDLQYLKSNDMETSTNNVETKNPLGIKGTVIIEADSSIMCPFENCKVLPTPHLVLTSVNGTQFTEYEVCNGFSCKKDKISDGLYVFLDNIPENYSGTNALTIRHINLGDLPWKKNDIIHIKITAFPATLLENNIVVRHADQTMHVDLGKSRIE